MKSKKYLTLALSILPLFGCSLLEKEIGLEEARSSFKAMEQKIKDGETKIPKDVTIKFNRVMSIPGENRMTTTSSFLVYSASSAYLYSNNVYDSGNGIQSDISNWIYEKDGQFIVATENSSGKDYISTPISEGNSFATTKLLDKYKGDVERYFISGVHYFYGIFSEIDSFQTNEDVYTSMGMTYSLDFHFFTKGEGHLRGETSSSFKKDGKATAESSLSVTFESGCFLESTKIDKEEGSVALRTETFFFPEASDIRYPDFVK